MTAPAAKPLGIWQQSDAPVASSPAETRRLIECLHLPLFLVGTGTARSLAGSGQIRLGESHVTGGMPLWGVIGPQPAQSLGASSFCQDHGVKWPYLSGAMAGGIGSESIVEEMARGGMLGVFGSAGLRLSRVEAALDRLQRRSAAIPFGMNLIHSPAEPGLERSIVDLYLRRNVRLIEASAFLDLTPNIIRYRLAGIHQRPDGTVVTPNQVVAKVSRVEVATRFFSPAPAKILAELVASGDITSDQARLAERIPVAQDLTAEADSGGHTDNRPLVTLLPTMIALRDRLAAQFHYAVPLRVGAAGGIATPWSAAAAFAMGASYIVTGSVQQACVESGTSDLVRQMLAEAEQADTIMAPAADMFEMGVKLQVLKRGTMFAMRAAKLYELYRQYPGLDQLPDADRKTIEQSLFKLSIDEVWQQTRAYFSERDPEQIVRAERDAKHKMALVFRWYLGQSSRWANAGDTGRRLDFQVWCGPAMGAFNEWTRGSFLQQPAERRVVTVAYNLLYGAAYALRLQALRSQGFTLTPELERIPPRTMDELRELLVA